MKAAALEEAARSWVRYAAMTSRRSSESAAERLVEAETVEAREPPARQARKAEEASRALKDIAERGLNDTFLLLNQKLLGDAKHEDLESFARHHSSLVDASTKQIMRVRALLRDPKFEKGKTVRECFTNLELARVFGQFR